MLYAVSYSFLLRVRDEGLPIRVGEIADWERVPKEDHSAFWVTGDELVLVLAKRKNRRRPTRLVRHCWCARRSRAELCPVHTIGSWLSALPRGATPFAELSGAKALAELRRRLAVLGEAEPERFRLHSFRGGHAMDVAQNGGRLAQILKAGDWRSPAFTAYLNASELETQVLAISSPRKRSHFFHAGGARCQIGRQRRRVYVHLAVQQCMDDRLYYCVVRSTPLPLSVSARGVRRYAFMHGPATQASRDTTLLFLQRVLLLGWNSVRSSVYPLLPRVPILAICCK